MTDGQQSDDATAPGMPDDLKLRQVLGEAQAQGFISAGNLSQSIAHAAGFAAALKGAPDRFIDLGSGGGLPGLVLALIWPETSAVLLDAGERRVDFLLWATEELHVADRVSVRRARAEAAGHDPGLRASFDVATARGFAPPAVTAECAAPMLRAGGRLVVSEPPAPPDDEPPTTRWPTDGLTLLGLTPTHRITAPYHYQVLTQASPCPSRYPRRTGIPAKRPLF